MIVDKIADWRKGYNEVRPHSSLDYRTPDEFARAIRRASGGKDATSSAWKTPPAFPAFPLLWLRDKFIRPSVRIVGAGSRAPQIVINYADMGKAKFASMID